VTSVPGQQPAASGLLLGSYAEVLVGILRAGPKSRLWVATSRGACPMPIPPSVSAVALRTVDLARSTAFYTTLGWELSAASTPAMSLFKTSGGLLLVCTDELLADLGGDEVAAALAGEPNGEVVLSIHVAPTRRSPRRSRRPPTLAGRSSSGPPPPRWAAPMPSSPIPTGTCGRSFTIRSTS
jgi:hypothetical protein